MSTCTWQDGQRECENKATHRVFSADNIFVGYVCAGHSQSCQKQGWRVKLLHGLQVCSCLGACRGAEKLGDGFVCSLECELPIGEMKTPLEKLNDMAAGKLAICSDDELDAMAAFDRSNFVRSRPNPARVGTKDTWECWIEQRDVNNLNKLHR